jgi:hypothetical protein
MKTSEINFLSGAEKLTLGSYQLSRKYSVVASEIVSRLAAAILLSPATNQNFQDRLISQI